MWAGLPKWKNRYAKLHGLLEVLVIMFLKGAVWIPLVYAALFLRRMVETTRAGGGGVNLSDLSLVMNVKCGRSLGGNEKWNEK